MVKLFSISLSLFVISTFRLLTHWNLAWLPGTRWAGWSAGLVGRHVKCYRRELEEGGAPGALSW